ncbi:MAG: penicillin acylase family protein, partial [Chloroflexota bacterium]|nr:penicillin acylase family protein [Chloroflexota bacterium]
LQTAANWDQFRAALSKWSVPGQNFVYADKQGNIGYQMTGDVPIRKKGDGSVPVPASTGEYDWTGMIPFADLPMSYNPPTHYLATANNKPFAPDYKYQVSGAWAPPWRIGRIVAMLKAKDKLSIDDIKAMQADTHSLLAQHLAPMIAGLKSPDPATQSVIDMFKGWDGDIKVDSTTASIYEVFYEKALSETLATKLGQDLYPMYIDQTGSALRSLEGLVDTPNDPLWDNSATPQKETRDDIFLRSLTDALNDMTTGLGSNMPDWQWGKLHQFQPSHPFGAQLGIFNLPAVSIGGDNTTVSVGSYSLLGSFTVHNHQSYRMIEDLGNWSNSLGIYANGQSGQPFNKHFSDMQGPWSRYEYNPLLYTRDEIAAHQEGVLTLTP